MKLTLFRFSQRYLCINLRFIKLMNIKFICYCLLLNYLYSVKVKNMYANSKFGVNWNLDLDFVFY